MEPFIVSAIWGICTLASMAATVRWYFPCLRVRENNEIKEIMSDDRNLRMRILIIAACVFSLVAGYRASITADSYVSLAKLLVGTCVVSCAVMTDMNFMIIPNIFVEALLIARVLFLVPEYFQNPEGVVPRLVSSVIGLLFCLITLCIVSLVTKGGLGYGDVKLVSCLSFLTGLYAGVNTIILACFSCGIAAAYLLLSGRKGMKDAIAFAPFILIGYEIMIIIAAF